MRILMVTDYLPYPPISGDTIRVYQLIRHLSQENELSLLVLFGTPEMSNRISHLQEFCKQVEIFNHRWPHPIACLPDLLRYLFIGRPLELRLLHSQELANRIKQLTSENDFDIVHIEHSRLALYKEYINPTSQACSVLAFQNIAYDQYLRISLIEKELLDKLRARFFSWQMQSWEPGYARSFARCLTVSAEDRQILLASHPELKIEVIPNGTDTQKYQLIQTKRDSFNLLFIGSMSYAPCVDGAIYFCTQILPHILQRFNAVEVWIVGSNPAPEVVRLANSRIHVTGFVEDILPYYQQASVSIVPLRAGGGTRLKILESMALGRPVVSTSIGCEGLNVQDFQQLLIADHPQDFAEKVMRLLSDQSLYQQVVTQARELVVTQYDWAVISEQLVDVYEDVLIQKQKLQKQLKTNK
jgi:glycosyltransferase involved in cell wall biosynthesis